VPGLSDAKIPTTLVFRPSAGWRMRCTLLIAIVTALASGFGCACANAEDIALSLVHLKGRIDVPVSALGRVDASATIAFRNTETGQVHEYLEPHVELCFAADVRKRICALTRQRNRFSLAFSLFLRHGRACPGHPRLLSFKSGIEARLSGLDPTRGDTCGARKAVQCSQGSNASVSLASTFSASRMNLSIALIGFLSGFSAQNSATSLVMAGSSTPPIST
jgi:hypothetical protein